MTRSVQGGVEKKEERQKGMFWLTKKILDLHMLSKIPIQFLYCLLYVKHFASRLNEFDL
jgi:hypothetical protein